MGARVAWALCRQGHDDDVSFSCSLCGQLLPGRKPVCSRPPCVHLGSSLAGDTHLELSRVFAWEGARPAGPAPDTPSPHKLLPTMPSRTSSPAGQSAHASLQPSDRGQRALPGQRRRPPWAQVTRAGLGLPEICSCHFCDSSWTGGKWPSTSIRLPELPGWPPRPVHLPLEVSWVSLSRPRGGPHTGWWVDPSPALNQQHCGILWLLVPSALGLETSGCQVGSPLRPPRSLRMKLLLHSF